MYHYAQSVLFESKQTLASGDPLTLDPINNDTNPAGYRFPFEVILPEQTAWHEVNSKNWQNKWKPRYPFLGFEEMHPLPPTLRTKGSRMLKEHECHLNYHIAAKCKKAKVKGATSTLWLPFTGVELYVWPTRNERSPEMKMLTLRSDPRKLKAGGAMTVAIKVPGVIAGGNRVTINVGVEGTTGGKEVVLSELVVKLKGEVWVRARNLLTGERHSMEKFKNVVGEWKGLNQRISGEVALQSELNKRTIPTFMSYVFALPEYTYAVGYTVIVGGEMVKGKIRGGPVKVMSSVLKR